MNKKIIPVFMLVAGVFATGCTGAAEKASTNLSTAADNFEIERRIVFINGITDKIPLVIEGRCSIKADGVDGQLEVTCKTGRNEFKKHFLGLSDNMTYIVEQTRSAKANVYRSRVMIRPEELIPDFNLNAGD
jgi:hypothetical protein